MTGPTARDHGWHKRNIFMQPVAEAVLRRGLTRFPRVRVELGTEFSDIGQDEHGVSVLTTDRDGGHREIRADYVIAADGGRSSVRSRLGIPLLRRHLGGRAMVELSTTLGRILAPRRRSVARVRDLALCAASRAGARHREQPHVPGDALVVEDLDNHLRPWFQTQGGDIALVRPDRCVAAVTDRDGFGPAIALLADRLTASGALVGSEGGP